MTERQEMLWILSFLTDQEIENFLIKNFIFGGRCFYPLHEIVSSIPENDIGIFKEDAEKEVLKFFNVQFFDI